MDGDKQTQVCVTDPAVLYDINVALCIAMAIQKTADKAVQAVEARLGAARAQRCDTAETEAGAKARSSAAAKQIASRGIWQNAAV